MESDFVPYCGAPPVPGGLHWNADPVLGAVLVAILGLYLAMPARPGRARASWSFVAGWAVLALALMSPLCSLSVALFSARIAQHMAILLVAVPLMVQGLGDKALPRLTAISPAAMLTVSTALFSTALWIWHLPGPYDATLRDNHLYWAMHVSLIATALMFWHSLFRHEGRAPGPVLMASLAVGVQMSALGALLALSGHVWFSAHEATTWPWSLSPLTDQQLGGMIMWIPGGVLLTGYTLILLARALRQPAAQA